MNLDEEIREITIEPVELPQEDPLEVDVPVLTPQEEPVLIPVRQ